MDIDTYYKSIFEPIHISHRKRDTEEHMTDYHAHDQHYEIYYLLSGERKYFIKDRTYYITPGNIVFIPKGDLHRTFHVRDYAHERILINFTERFFSGLTKNEALNIYKPFQQTTIMQLNVYERQAFENVLFLIVREIQKQEEGCELYIKSLLIQLLLSAARHIIKHNVLTEKYESSLYHKVTDIIHYIDKYYDKPDLTLSAVADAFYISPSYLSRIFKESSGFTFSEYLNTVRIQAAQQLLRDTEWKVIDVAEAVGFNNLVHFGRVFKKITSFSPSGYRQNQQNNM